MACILKQLLTALGMLETLPGQIGRVAGHWRRCRYEQRMLTDHVGYRPRLVWPRSFTEKLLRRKLRRPPAEWSTLADKAAAKELVAAKLGDRYLTRTYLIATRPQELSFSGLPPRFAVKATHASGWNLFVRGRHDDPAEAQIRATCGVWLSRRYGSMSGETWYSRIPPRVLVEELLEDSRYGVPLDYKCWAFHGRVEYVQVDAGRFGDHARTFYDRDWNVQPWIHSGVTHAGEPKFRAGEPLPRPGSLTEILQVADALAEGLDFVRVDLYCVNDAAIYFGEFTLMPAAGWGRFWPGHDIDFALGRLW